MMAQGFTSFHLRCTEGEDLFNYIIVSLTLLIGVRNTYFPDRIHHSPEPYTLPYRPSRLQCFASLAVFS